MNRALWCGWLWLLATDASAHQLDEYLQVTRVALATNRIDLAIDLTPGVAVAGQVMAVMDTDHDGQVSAKETTAYAERVFSDLAVRLDDERLKLTVTEAVCATVPEMKAGVGVIRLKASVPVKPLAAGSHALRLTNRHLPAISVYLVNALVPKDPSLRIKQQARDELQQDYRLTFEAAPPASP